MPLEKERKPQTYNSQLMARALNAWLVAAHILVLLARRKAKLFNLASGAIILALLNEVLDGGEAFHGALEQKDMVERDTRTFGSSGGDFHGTGDSEEKLCLGRVQRITHLLDIIGRRGTRDDTAGAKDAEHGTWVPDGVGRKQGDGLTLLEAIFLDEGGGEMGRVVFEVGVAQVLLGKGIGEALDLVWPLGAQRAVFRVEEPCPDREVPWH